MMPDCEFRDKGSAAAAAVAEATVLLESREEQWRIRDGCGIAVPIAAHF
jgi:hypothetical protein